MNLHDHAIWDGGWDWDDNTYSDGRQVMIQVRIINWQTLFDEVERNPAIKCYGDGVINDHPEGVVCLITPPDPGPVHECGHPVIEISLTDLLRQPWMNIRWNANTAAEQGRPGRRTAVPAPRDSFPGCPPPGGGEIPRRGDMNGHPQFDPDEILPEQTDAFAADLWAAFPEPNLDIGCFREAQGRPGGRAAPCPGDSRRERRDSGAENSRRHGDA